MKLPVIVKSGAEIAAEAARLRRFQEIYEHTAQLNSGPLSDVAVGGSDALAWVLGETPTLSGCLESALRCALASQPHIEAAPGLEAAWWPPWNHRRRNEGRFGVDYDFKKVAELGWFVAVAVIAFIAQATTQANFQEVAADWQTYAVCVLSGAARAGVVAFAAALMRLFGR